MKRLKILGFTLVETLVAIVIGVISVAALFYSYQFFNKSYQSILDKASISKSGRTSLGMIVRDLRNAGYKDINYEQTSGKSFDRWIEKKDSRFAVVNNYKVTFNNYSSKGSDYLAIWYNTSPKDRVEIRYYLTKYNQNKEEKYLAREVLENPTVIYVDPRSNTKYGYGKRIYCTRLRNQRECSPMIVVPFASDFQVVFKDVDGNELKTVCHDCGSVGIENQKKVHTAEIYLTVRSPNEIYSKKRLIKFINHDVPNEEDDRFHRETFFVSTYLRNIVNIK